MSENGRKAADSRPRVGLEEQLRAKESRMARQLEMLERHGLPLLSMTLVSPGPVKDSPQRRSLADRAEATLLERLGRVGVGVLERERNDGATGPELLLAVDCAPLVLKRIAMGLEDEEPWGRLIDADVIPPEAPEDAETDSLKAYFGPSFAPAPLRRESIGAPSRPCLLCARPAAECMAERRHELAALEAEVERLLVQAVGTKP